MSIEERHSFFLLLQQCILDREAVVSSFLDEMEEACFSCVEIVFPAEETRALTFFLLMPTVF